MCIAAGCCMNDGRIHDFMCMHDYWGMPMWG